MNRNKFLLNLWVAFSAVVIVAEQAHASGAYNMQAFWRRPMIQATAAGGFSFPSVGWTTGGSIAAGPGDGMLNTPYGVFVDSGGSVYVADSNNDRINKYTASTGAFVGWIGKIATSPTGGAAGCSGAAVGTFTPGWCTGGTATSGADNGMMTSPGGVFVDSGGSLYVADSSNHRINKYTASTGAFVGWIGKIATSPTGGAAGCNGAGVGTFTPGWCTGGTAAPGYDDGMMAGPGSVFVDGGGSLYVAEQGSDRINKYTASSGAFVGWVGKILTSPTGGAVGCNGAAAGTFTPGWCTGGAGRNGTGDGMMDDPRSVFVDGGGSLYVADQGNNRINKYTASTGVFVGWVGKIATSPTGGAAGCNGAVVNTFTPGWCTGGRASFGTGDGMMAAPGGVFVDSGGSLYVADQNNSRISKYTASTGAFVGWIGKITSSPTGGAVGCSGAGVNTFTPGWCTGGSASFGTGDGMMTSPISAFVDSGGFLYVADYSNHRINKYTASTGSNIGATGATAQFQTWRSVAGGATVSGSGDGMVNSPSSVIVDSGGFLYVADTVNHRINKYTASNGVFVGWIGKIGTSPTGGTAGCNGAGVGTLTPGWCIGGTAASGAGNGMMADPKSVFVDSGGFLYVADSNNNRINKYTASTGAFVGWIGKIATSPTGGAAGCSGAAVGTFTPGWCAGGTASTGAGDGMMAAPRSVSVDSGGSLYVADSSNGRINKYTASTGAFVGWIGKILTSPTGGATGCNGAGVGTFTPGWCVGGTASTGAGDGMMAAPLGVSVDSGGSLYVADANNNRINKYTASTGAFVGWIGKILTSPSGGAAGCKGAAVGTFTPGWCTGGRASLGTGDGMMSSPGGVFMDSGGSLFVVDDYNHRINKYKYAAP